MRVDLSRSSPSMHCSEDLEVLDAALERHNAGGGRASRSYAVRWLINYAEEHGLWDELPKRF